MFSLIKLVIPIKSGAASMTSLCFLLSRLLKLSLFCFFCCLLMYHSLSFFCCLSVKLSFSPNSTRGEYFILFFLLIIKIRSKNASITESTTAGIKVPTFCKFKSLTKLPVTEKNPSFSLHIPSSHSSFSLHFISDGHEEQFSFSSARLLPHAASLFIIFSFTSISQELVIWFNKSVAITVKL